MGFSEIDSQLFFVINHGAANNLFDGIMPLITAKGYFLLLFYPFYLLSRAYKERHVSDRNDARRTAFMAVGITFISLLLTDWIGLEIKNAIGRVRPCNALEGVRLLVGCTQSKSMPSNHASNAFAAAVALTYLSRSYISRAGLFYPFLIAGLIAFSRVYVGVHYPVDIATGALLGILVAAAVIHLYTLLRKSYVSRPYKTLLIAGLAAISLFRIYYILHGPLDLSPDEAHYWEWSRRLDWSYYSKGPMVAYLIRAGTALFGDTVFGIRIMAVLCSVLSSVYVFKLVNLMYISSAGAVGSPGVSFAEAREGLIAALLLQIIPLFAPFGIIFSIDSPFIFFWVLSLYLFWKAMDAKGESASQKVYTWVLLGISLGFGLLTKYTMAFFYPAAFLFLLLSEKRSLLKQRGPYIALGISLLVFSPVIIWNIRNDWVTVRHTAGQAHVAQGLSLSAASFFEFLGSQIGVVTPLLFALMFYASFKGRVKNKSHNNLFILCFSLTALLFFLLKSMQGKVQANWAMHGYITNIIAFSHYYFGSTAEHRQEKRRAFSWLAISAIVVAFLFTSLSHYPALLKLSPKLDPSARLRGWSQLGSEMNKQYDNLAAKGRVLVFSDSYQVAGELAFYINRHPQTYTINLGRRMNQYDLWPDMNTDVENLRRSGDVTAYKINGIFVTSGRVDMPPELANSFESYERKGLSVFEKEHLLREYSIFICYNFRGLRLKTPHSY